MPATGAVLAFDFASPLASVALAASGEILATDAATRGDEGDLLRRLADVLRAAGVAPRELGGVVALAGPGSFTGLRIACATALALAQAWQTPAGGASSLAALAWSAPPGAGDVFAAVDALRGEWFVQRFGPADAAGVRAELGEARLWRPGDPLDGGADAVVTHDASRLANATDLAPSIVETSALAAVVARVASRPGWRWRSDLLAHPIYLRAAAVTLPRA
jgi:tRNA threonylcarbamoyladenosine biosynthesis protein TsaB